MAQTPQPPVGAEHAATGAGVPQPPWPSAQWTHVPYPPLRASGVHPLVWVGLALGLVGAFFVAGLFAAVMAVGYAHTASVAPAPAPVAPSTSRPAPPLFVEDDDTDEAADPSDPADLEGHGELPVHRRAVPVLDVRELDGCSSADLALVEARIDDAIDVGAPEYNRGDFFRCYLEYEKAASDIVAKLPRACSGPRRALEDGRKKARSTSDASARAWAMRDAFDGLLDVMERKGPDL